ncbi:MAG: hypothetical protein NVSMB42_00820 [Herpetosiphon sp.]
MIELAFPLQPSRPGDPHAEKTLAQLDGFGFTALELNLPPHFAPSEYEDWRTLVDDVWQRFRLHVHAPLPHPGEAWLLVARLLERIMARQESAPMLIVHAPYVRQLPGDAGWLETTMTALPPATRVCVELGWQQGAALTWQAQWRRWRAQRARQAREQGRPQGMGQGMGSGASASPRRVHSPQGDVVPVQRPRQKGRGLLSAAGSREAVFAVVEQAQTGNPQIAWDLAHDWLGGPWSAIDAWQAVPPPHFLQRVGYVRVHDVLDDGTDHMPLMAGNVPYTSQLRRLTQMGFDGPICLALHASAAAQRFGNWNEVLGQSVTILRQALRQPALLPVQHSILAQKQEERQ